VIAGIGTDILEIERMRAFLKLGQPAVDRVFTRREQELANVREDRVPFYAGRFAAKEAAAKALGPPLGWHEVEILADASGRPVAVLHGRAARAAEGARVLVSISHSRSHAVAVAIVERR
jgi:holo-[acyl-carrier protein] synthase